MLTNEDNKSWTIRTSIAMLMACFMICGFTVAQAPDEPASGQPLPALSSQPLVEPYPLPSFHQPESPLQRLPMLPATSFAPVETWQKGADKYVGYKIDIYEGTDKNLTEFAKLFGNDFDAQEGDIQQGFVHEIDMGSSQERRRLAKKHAITLIHSPTLVAKLGAAAEMFMGKEVPFAEANQDEHGRWIPDVTFESIGFKFSIQSRLGENNDLISFIDIEDSEFSTTESIVVQMGNGDEYKRPQVNRTQLQTTLISEFGQPAGIISQIQQAPDQVQKSRLIVFEANRIGQSKSR